MEINELLSHFQRIQKRGSYFTCQCPAHDDKKNSLSVSLDSDRILVKCHAGCNTADVVKAAGLKMSDLFLNPKKPTPGSPRPEISKVYDYTDADGNLLFQCVRFNPKDFRQRRPDGNGGYTWDLKGVTTVLYHLPEVIKAVQSGGRIIVTEGEKDIDNIRKWGFTATTSPMGAGKWRSSYTDTLKGAREVILIAHKDGPGRKHIEQIAGELRGKVDSLKIIEMPDLAGRKAKDFTDWLEAGGTKEDFEKLIEMAPPDGGHDDKSETPLPPAPVAYIPEIEYNDVGNAGRLVKLNEGNIRYNWKRGKWLVCNGKVWVWDDGDLIGDLAVRAAATFYLDAANEYDAKKQKELGHYAIQIRNASKLKAMCETARSFQGIPIDLAELDANPWLFNCQNGTVDLKTGGFREHRREDYCTVMAPVSYVPEARSKLWDRFLDRIMGGNQALIAYLQKLAGMSMTADATSQVVPFLYGTGDNGKTTFLYVISHLLGEYGYTLNAETLMLKRGDAHSSTNDELANLNGKRAVFAREIQKSSLLNASEIKSMTGGEQMNVARKYEHNITFAPTFKLWLAGNHKPKIHDPTQGTWRRIKLIPFEVTIPENEKDPRLMFELTEPNNLSAVFNWAIAGCLAWQKDGLGEPYEVKEATNDYRKQEDDLMEFLEECCTYDPIGTVGKTELFTKYGEWCKENECEAMEAKYFKQRLEERGHIKDVRAGHNAVRAWRGLRLKTEADNADNADKTDTFSIKPPSREDSAVLYGKRDCFVSIVSKNEQFLGVPIVDDNLPPSVPPAPSGQGQSYDAGHVLVKDFEQFFGVPPSVVLKVWHDAGKPVIHVADGVNITDLDTFFSQPQPPEQLARVKEWYERVTKK